MQLTGSTFRHDASGLRNKIVQQLAEKPCNSGNHHIALTTRSKQDRGLQHERVVVVCVNAVSIGLNQPSGHILHEYSASDVHTAEATFEESSHLHQTHRARKPGAPTSAHAILTYASP